MFKISRKQTIIRASILGSLVIAILSMATFFIVNNRGESHATTRDGANVQIDFKDNPKLDLVYGTKPWMTHWYKITSGSNHYNAYCAESSKGDPTQGGTNKEADRMKVNDKNNAIKLMVYLRNNAPSNAIFNPAVGNSFWGRAASGEERTIGNEERKFVFAHAVINAIYNDDASAEQRYYGYNDNAQAVATVNNAITTLYDMIAGTAGDSQAWKDAQNYILFRTAPKETGQVVVWIEPGGSIIVNKTDSVTGATPQGDGSFAGITFTLSDGTTSIEKQLAAGATSVVFSGLDLDKTYTISENGGTGYNISPAQGSITPSATGTPVTFSNNIKKGKLTVRKIDKETGSCTNITKGLSLAGIEFRLYNESSNSVYYDNNTIPVHGLVATRQLTNDNPCFVSFEGLPYGRYELEEFIPDNIKGWVKDTTRKPITIYPNSDSDPAVEYPIENQPIRGDLRFVKKDPANDTTMSNAIFEITSISNDYAESHIVVADENGIVDTGANLHSFNTNGYDEPYYNFTEDSINLPYAGYGTWFGIDSNNQPINVKDDVGALPYGTYLIQEKRCDQFIFCKNVNNAKKVFSITEHGTTVLLDGTGIWNNDCAEFTLVTTATDTDGDHYVEAGQDTVIKDVVDYCAKAGFTFTIKGTLMDKSTGQPLLINGEPVEQTTEVSPTDNDCGKAELSFPLNSSDLVGKSIVVFEKLYYKNDVKASHENIDDPNQTIDIVSLKTTAKNEENGEQFFVEGEEEVTIIDTVEYCLTKEKPIVVKGILMNKNTGEPLLINGEKVEQTASVLHARDENCGTLDLSFTIEDTTDLSGTPIVVYETLYEIVPVPGGGAGEGTEEEVISHEDLNDEKQTVYPISISTTVQPNETGTKVFPLNSDVTVTDMVHYCLQPGLEYTVKGVVMDKSTGNGLLVDSQPVEQSVTFTPTEYCGEFPMYYTFNTRGLTGAQLVVFETLYYNDETLIEHKDINNELESFEIDIEAPETGYAAKMSTGTTDTSHIELLFISAFAMAPVIVYSASHILAKRKITFRK